MSCFTLKLDPLIGTDFRSACREARTLANTFGLSIEFVFNGKSVYIRSNMSDDDLVFVETLHFGRKLP